MKSMALAVKQPSSIEECSRRLKQVVYTLENLEVKGRSNMDILLGSMQAIDQVIMALEKGMAEMASEEPKIEIVQENEQTPV